MAASSRTSITRAALLFALLAAGLTYGLWFAERRERGAAGLAPTPEIVAGELTSPATLAEAEARARATAAADSPAIVTPPEPLPTPAAVPDVPAVAPLGRIFGRVLGPDGQPAVGRAVRVLRTNGKGVEKATTDADGVYDQRGLEATRYHVSTQPAEAELAALGLVSKLGGIEWLAQESVVLGPGQEVQVDLGYPPEHPIRVHGRLVGGDAETSAVLQWVPEDEFGYDLARYVPTRADGTYEGLLARPGPYHVAAIVSPGSIRVDGAVHVPDTSDFEHDIVLPRGRLVVTVTAEGGTPIRGAVVDLGPRAGIAPIPGMSSSSFIKRTSAEGRVEVGFLRAGTWNVAVHDAKLADGTPLAAEHRTVRLADSAAETEVVFELRPGSAVKGTVTGEDGAPFAGATVVVFDAAGEPLSPLQGARSNKAGEFTLTGLAHGDYALVAANGERWSLVQTFTLREGEPPPSPSLTLVSAARLVVDHSALGEPAWIDVRDERGRLFSALLDWNLFSGGHVRRASTIELRYDLPAGNYSVRAMGAGGVLTTWTVALVAGEPSRVSLR
jgi:hypothetical protein